MLLNRNLRKIVWYNFTLKQLSPPPQRNTGVNQWRKYPKDHNMNLECQENLSFR